MKRTLDVRTLECPKPVLETQKVLKEGGFRELEVIVGNMTARENIKRLAQSNNLPFTLAEEAGDIYRFVLSVGGAEAGVPAKDEEVQVVAAAQGASARTYMILSEELGSGASELGKILMKGFLYTLTQAEPLPKTILLLNSGVKLSTENEETVQHLKALAERGVEIYSCGTCLNFFDLADKLQVGVIGNMYDVVDNLARCGNVVTIG